MACLEYLTLGKDGFDALLGCKQEIQHNEVILSVMMKEIFDLARDPLNLAEYKMFQEIMNKPKKHGIKRNTSCIVAPSEAGKRKEEFPSEPSFRRNFSLQAMGKRSRTIKHFADRDQMGRFLENCNRASDGQGNVLDKRLMRNTLLYSLIEEEIVVDGSHYFVFNPTTECRIVRIEKNE